MISIVVSLKTMIIFARDILKLCVYEEYILTVHQGYYACVILRISDSALNTQEFARPKIEIQIKGLQNRGTIKEEKEDHCCNTSVPTLPVEWNLCQWTRPSLSDHINVSNRPILKYIMCTCSFPQSQFSMSKMKTGFACKHLLIQNIHWTVLVYFVGLPREAVDVIELHDCFSVNELITYEALGLCDPGLVCICTSMPGVIVIRGVSFRRFQYMCITNHGDKAKHRYGQDNKTMVPLE